MDRAELKNTLQKQSEPLDAAVQKKLVYLQSDDVFEMDAQAGYDAGFDDSLENAFAQTMKPQPIMDYSEPSTEETDRMAQYPDSKPKLENVSEHTQNMAARIAALRGISLPGDYIRKKNF